VQCQKDYWSTLMIDIVDSSNYSLPCLHTRVEERTFAYAGPAAWNQLPESIRQLQTTSFKHKLKTFLFLQCYNSADWLFLLFTNFSFTDNIMHLCPWPHCNRRIINSMIMIMMTMMAEMKAFNDYDDESATKRQLYSTVNGNSACIMCLHLWNLEWAHHWWR